MFMIVPSSFSELGLLGTIFDIFFLAQSASFSLVSTQAFIITQFLQF